LIFRSPAGGDANPSFALRVGDDDEPPGLLVDAGGGERGGGDGGLDQLEGNGPGGEQAHRAPLANSLEELERGPAGSAEQLFGDRHPLHVAGAFVNPADLGVAVELLDRVVSGEADSAENLDGEAGHLLGNPGAE